MPDTTLQNNKPVDPLAELHADLDKALAEAKAKAEAASLTARTPVPELSGLTAATPNTPLSPQAPAPQVVVSAVRTSELPAEGQTRAAPTIPESGSLTPNPSSEASLPSTPQYGPQSLGSVMGPDWKAPADRVPPPSIATTLPAQDFTRTAAPPVVADIINEEQVPLPNTNRPFRPFDVRIRALATDKASLADNHASLLRNRRRMAEEGATSQDIQALQLTLGRVREQLSDCVENLRIYERTQSMLSEWERLSALLAQIITRPGASTDPSVWELHEQMTALQEDINEHLARISAFERNAPPTLVN